MTSNGVSPLQQRGKIWVIGAQPTACDSTTARKAEVLLAENDANESIMAPPLTDPHHPKKQQLALSHDKQAIPKKDRLCRDTLHYMSKGP